MTHILFEQEASEADPRRHPSPNMDDDRGKSEDVYDPYEDEDNEDSDVIPSRDEEFEDDDEEKPSSNERRGYGHVPRQR
jgi:hypothetical protein